MPRGRPNFVGSRAALLTGVAMGLLAATSAKAQDATNQSGNTIQEVVVTGTSIRGVAPIGSNLISVGRADIDATPALNVNDLLATVPTLASFNTLPNATTFIPGGSSPAIHGITSAGATLSLIDGNRFAGSGVTGTLPDPSVIPLSAVERIEIVPDGASSIYGSDAVAGVLNVITRKSYNGVEAAATYGAADQYSTYDFNAILGKTWDRGGIYIAYDYSAHSNLVAGNRSFAGLDQTARGGSDYRVNYCNPATIGVAGVNYALPGLAPNTQNLCDPSSAQDLLPSIIRNNVFVKGYYQLTDRIEAFGEISFNTSVQHDRIAQTRQALTVPSTNPYFIAPPGTNATVETVDYDLSADFGPVVDNSYTTEAITANGGFNVDLGHEWNLAATGNVSTEWDELRTRGVDSVQLQNAVDGTTTATAFNPYGIGPATNPAVISALTNSGLSFNKATSKIEEGELKADGPLFSLPGGDVKAAVGFDIRHESWAAEELGNPSLAGGGPEDPLLRNGGGRTIESLFGELFIPIVGDGNALPGLRRLDISVSGRYDHYSDFGGTTNPKVGINWAPMTGLTFRGSWGTSFNAPNLGDAHAVDTRIQPEPAIFGPALGNLLVLAGGNPGLKPQTATTWSGGVDFNPTFAPHLKLSATYFYIDFRNLIEIPSLGDLLSGNPAFAKYIIFNPTQAQINTVLATAPVNGAIFTPVGTIVDLRRTNLGEQQTGGVDFDVSYTLPTQAGTFTPRLGGTYFTQYATAAVSGAPLISTLGQTVRLKMRGGVSWNLSSWQAGVYVNYTSPYDNLVSTPIQRVDAFTTVDLHLAYEFKTSGWTNGTQLVVDVSNLFDVNPPFYNAPDLVGSTAGYDLANASPLGRLVTIGVRKKF